MNASSINCKSIAVLKEKLESFDSFVPSLGICFSSNSFLAEEIQETFDTKEADVLLLLTCIGRYASLGLMLDNKEEGICKIWDEPIAGVFTSGEIGKIKNGDCEFYNITSSLVVLKQR